MFARVLVLAPDSYHSRHRHGFFAMLRQRIALHRSRAALAKLDAHLLADIGLEASEAARESKLPLWR